MNENPGGSPNPLNPNPGVGPDTNNNPQSNNPGSFESFETEEHAQMAEATPQGGVNAFEDDAQNAELDPLAKATAGITDASDPSARPMEKAATPEAAASQPQKKKTGLIIGIVAAVLLICGGIVAAILLLGNKGDAVAQAIQKIADGNIPANASVSGTIDILPKSSDSVITDLLITVNSQAATKSLMNSTSVGVTATFQENETVSFEVDELYAANGDLYLKVDGIADAIRDYGSISSIVKSDSSSNALEETDLEDDETKCVDSNDGTKCGSQEIEVDCIDGEETDCVSDVIDDVEDNCLGDADMNCVETYTPQDDEIMDALEEFAGVIELIDGQWLKLSTDMISQMTSGVMTDDNVTCVTNLANDVSKNTNSISGAYSNSPFITSTTEGVTLASKSGSPVYKITLDTDKLEGFVDTVGNFDFVKDYYSCIGADGYTVKGDAVASEIKNLPALYVEVDKDYNFSRVYFSEDSSSDYTLTTDFSFTYPSSINVAEPTDYKDFTDLVQEIMNSMYSVDDTSNIEVVE